ncbi:hypothetical protein [Kitasatospora sp. NBC_00315]
MAHSITRNAGRSPHRPTAQQASAASEPIATTAQPSAEGPGAPPR